MLFALKNGWEIREKVRENRTFQMGDFPFIFGVRQRRFARTTETRRKSLKRIRTLFRKCSIVQTESAESS